MTVASRDFRRSLARRWFIGFAAVICVGLSSCADRSSSGAWGGLTGISIGALVGSGSGHALGGAFIGGMVGRDIGTLSGNRAVDAARLRSDLPQILRGAKEFDASLAKDHSRVRQQASSVQIYDRQMASGQAKQRIKDADNWLRLLQRCDREVGRGISGETSHPSGNLGELLGQRAEISKRVNSIRMHQSWYRSFVS